MSEAEKEDLLRRENDLLDRFSERMNEPSSLAKKLADWWKPLGILFLVATLWTRMDDRVTALEETLAAHLGNADIHATTDAKRLLILSETEDLRDTLATMSDNQIRLIQSVDALKEEVALLKKGITGS